jgi:hypothetical protein
MDLGSVGIHFQNDSAELENLMSVEILCKNQQVELTDLGSGGANIHQSVEIV